MALTVSRCFEYVAECDSCGYMEVLHTGDCPVVNGVEIFVHNTQTVIKGLEFHQTKNGFLCDDCYKKIKCRK